MVSRQSTPLLSVLVLVLAGCSSSAPAPITPEVEEVAVLPATHALSFAGTAFAPVVAINPNDSAHLVIAVLSYTKEHYEVETAVSRDRGVTWASSVVDAPAVVGSYPLAFATAVSFAPDGTVYLAARLEGWVQGGAVTLPAQTVLFESQDGGGTFGRASMVAPGSFMSYADDVRPPLAVSPDDGAVHVAFTQTSEQGSGSVAFVTEQQAFVATSRDRGATWTQAPLLPSGSSVTVVPLGDGNGSFVGDFQLAALPGGIVHAIWAYRADFFGDPELWLASSSDGGLTFRPGRRIAVVTHGDCEIDGEGRDPGGCKWTARQRPSLATLPEGKTLAVAYTIYADGAARPVSIVSTDGGASWSEPAPFLAADGHDHYFPRIAYDGHGVLHAVLYGSETDDNGTWLNLVHLVANQEGGFVAEPVTERFLERHYETDRLLAFPSDANALAIVGDTVGFAWMQQERILYANLSATIPASANHSQKSALT